MSDELYRSQGYSITPIVPAGKNPLLPNWQNGGFTGAWPAKHGIGVLTGFDGHIALDIDIYNPAITERMHMICSAFIPGYIYRTGQPPKFLIPAVCHEITGKMISKRFRDPADDTVNAIEILASGQQWVIQGIHPDTLSEYTLSAPMPPLVELPVVSLEIIEAIFEQFYLLAAEFGLEEIVTAPSLNRKKQTAREFAYNQEYDAGALLLHYGWTQAGENRYTRPGKTHGVSATITENVAYVFTSSSMLEPMQNHRPYDIVLAYGFHSDEEAMIKYSVGVLDAKAREAFSNPPVSGVPMGAVTPDPPAPDETPPPPVGVTPPTEVPATDRSKVEIKTGLQLMTPSIQLSYFDGFTYVGDSNKILTPHGMMFDQSSFNAMYGGWDFNMDSNMDKITKDPWKAFTNSQAINFPKVDHLCFKPKKEFGDVITDSIGHTNVNTYKRPIIKSVPGDIMPFTNHLLRLLPNPDDRMQLLCYMAAVVQHQGEKFQWAVLVQGVQGNGKSLLTSCLMEAIGQQYCHTPNPNDISNKFNAWLEGNILVIIEEIKVAGKWEIMEMLKPMISQKFQEIQGKGKDQRVGEICANFWFNSNYKDALIKTRDDRRLCPFFTAQQRPEDLIRDGMGGDYFYNLYVWFRTEGYARVTNFLMNMEIPDELNPAVGCQRAPETSSTAEAINMSFGKAEQEIFAAISEERPGFMGGWVSSMAIDKLFKDTRATKPKNAYRSMMLDMGYILHPGLGKEGRCTTKNLLDGGKTKLYVKSGHLNNQIQGPGNISRAYINAQGFDIPQAQEKVV